MVGKQKSGSSSVFYLTCLCYLAIVVLGSIVMTSLWLLCIYCCTSWLVSQLFYTEYEPKIQYSSLAYLQLASLECNAWTLL